MCDFKPGDEIICIDDNGLLSTEPKRGEVYTAGEIQTTGRGAVFVRVIGFKDAGFGFYARRFCKVIRRNDSLSIEAFLTIKPGQYEDPRRKERVRA